MTLGDPGLRIRDVNMTLECFKGYEGVLYPLAR